MLMKRRGSTVGRRSILKSFNLAHGHRAPVNALQLEGVTDIRYALLPDGFVMSKSLHLSERRLGLQGDVHPYNFDAAKAGDDSLLVLHAVLPGMLGLCTVLPGPPRSA